MVGFAPYAGKMFLLLVFPTKEEGSGQAFKQSTSQTVQIRSLRQFVTASLLRAHVEWASDHFASAS